MSKRNGLVHHGLPVLHSNSEGGSEGGFTLVELLVVIAIIALLMAVLMPVLSRAREQGKRAACLYYQRQLTSAWMMYADDNGDKIVCGDSEEYGDADNPAPPPANDAYNSAGDHYRDHGLGGSRKTILFVIIALIASIGLAESSVRQPDSMFKSFVCPRVFNNATLFRFFTPLLYAKNGGC